MEELIAYRTELLTQLQAVVEKISKAVTYQPNNAWHTSSTSGGHTRHYIVFHLRALDAQFFIPQLVRILDEDTPDISIFDDEAWMAAHYSAEEPVSSILEEIAKLRQQELRWLRNLSGEGWSRTARHPWWGLHALQWWVELQLDCSFQHLRSLSPTV